MGEYHGDVIVVDHEGEEHSAHAMLHSWTEQVPLGPDPVVDGTIPGLRHWQGRLSGDLDWWAALDAGAITLRIGDREGEAIVVGYDAADELGPVSIQGSGPAPFD